MLSGPFPSLLGKAGMGFPVPLHGAMQSPPRWDRFEVRASPESLEGARDARVLKLCFTLAGSLVPPGRPLMGAEPHLARSGARLD